MLCYDYGDNMSYEARLKEVKEITERLINHEFITVDEAKQACELFIELANAKEIVKKG